MIEDDPAIVKAVEKTLTMSPGYSLDWVSDPDKAVAEAVARKPDLVLLDVRLPGGDGRVLLRALKENAATGGIPVILLTGLANEGDKVLGLNLGADDYVVKPFGAMELMARITAVLRRSGPGAGAARTARAGGLVLNPSGRQAAASPAARVRGPLPSDVARRQDLVARLSGGAYLRLRSFRPNPEPGHPHQEPAPQAGRQGRHDSDRAQARLPP
jgi:DNA-binding response OmpR family regulator